MCPQSAALAADIGFHCTIEELCMCLQRIMSGSPLPGNVINYVNPYQYVPSNLPGGVWYFIHSNENKDTNLGYWRAKGEACRIFSNSSITGWRTTLEFYEGQTPHECKTNWVMQEYRITQNRLSENSKSKEASLLCRVFLGDDEQKSNCKQLQDMVNSDSASHSTQSVVPQAKIYTGQGSTSRPQVRKDNETGTLIVTERLPDHHIEIMPEIDCLSRGDYLELLDLDQPASASFSSDSSCLTMSSDECFDSLALLEDLDPENRQNPVNKNSGCKFSISASIRPDELVMHPASSGSFNKSPSEKRVESRSSTPSLAVCGKITEQTSKNMSRNQKPDERNEVPSNSHNAAASGSSHSAAPEGKKKAAVGRIGRTKKLKKKYFCFMPF